MAEKSIQIPVAPEVTNSKNGSLRRISTGGVSPSNRTEKVLPHYLRASTGSCHDFCKYGRKHAFEAKERLPTRKGIIVSSDNGHSLTKTVTQANRKVKPILKPKLSSDARVQVPDTAIIKLQAETVKPVAISSGKRIDGTGRDSSTPAEMEKKPVVKQKPPPNSRIKVSSAPKMIQKEAKIVKKEYLSPAIETDATAKTGTALKPNSMRAESPPFASSVPGGQTGRRNSNTKKVNNIGTSKIAPKKALALPRISLSVKPSINRVASLNARKYRASKALKNQEKVKTAEAKLLNEEEVSEKTLYVIETEPEIKQLETSNKNGTCSTLSSPSSSLASPVSSSLASSTSMSLQDEEGHEESESTLGDESDSITDHVDTENEMEKLKDEFKKRLRRAATVHPENDGLAWKLKFRRGMVVDLPSENNAPRRLKFKKGRRFGDNQNSRDDLGRKSLKRREVGEGDTNSAEAESEKIILRHQDANGKKDAQGLLNNVIEETASKLVETRKSKVKALVGAFETVISLQDGKPSATSAS